MTQEMQEWKVPKTDAERASDDYGRFMGRLIHAIQCEIVLDKEGSKHMPSDKTEEAAGVALTDEILFCLKELGYESFFGAE